MILIRRVASIIVIILMMMQVGGCQRNGTIKVGFAGEISGKGADLGIGARNGVMMAAEEINQMGGIHGKKIEVITRDDQ
ncbi:MAG TPA: ABC transporter substrate-binding protein, partial [Anaerolineaceae bacterium]|nr:ABC transporter substrate-binding protein [Anaerolineaceae bacterium]